MRFAKWRGRHVHIACAVASSHHCTCSPRGAESRGMEIGGAPQCLLQSIAIERCTSPGLERLLKELVIGEVALKTHWAAGSRFPEETGQVKQDDLVPVPVVVQPAFAREVEWNDARLPLTAGSKRARSLPRSIPTHHFQREYCQTSFHNCPDACPLLGRGRVSQVPDSFTRVFVWQAMLARTHCTHAARVRERIQTCGGIQTCRSTGRPSRADAKQGAGQSTCGIAVARRGTMGVIFCGRGAVYSRAQQKGQAYLHALLQLERTCLSQAASMGARHTFVCLT